jgi:hypothetical protein
MAILDNFENWFELEDHQCLATKIFSETVCKDCSVETESSPITPTDSMGRKIYWQD